MKQDSIKELKDELELIRKNKQSLFSGLYFTLISVIGSVAIGLVANELRKYFKEFVNPCNLSIEQWAVISLSAASVAITVTVICGYVLTISYFYWELSNRDIIIPMLIGISLCFMSTNISQPQTWLLWTSILGIVAGSSFTRTRDKIDKSKVKVIKTLEKIIKEFKNINSLKTEYKKFRYEELSHLNKSRWICFGLGFLFLLIFVHGISCPSEATYFYHSDYLFIFISIIVIVACVCLIGFRYKPTFIRRKNTFKLFQDEIDKYHKNLLENEDKRKESCET